MAGHAVVWQSRIVLQSTYDECGLTSWAELAHGVPLLGRLVLGSQGVLGPGRSLPSLLVQLQAAAEPERPCEISGKALQQRQLCGWAHNPCCTPCAHKKHSTHHMTSLCSNIQGRCIPSRHWLQRVA